MELHDAEVALIAGGGGIFDIVVDGKLAFSKSAEGRYPEDNDLLKISE